MGTAPTVSVVRRGVVLEARRRAALIESTRSPVSRRTEAKAIDQHACTPVVSVAFRRFQVVLLGICCFGRQSLKMQKPPAHAGEVHLSEGDLLQADNGEHGLSCASKKSETNSVLLFGARHS